MSRSYIFTSESVSEGHPDKIADIISDTILDEILKITPDAKVACETFIADEFIVVAGEFRISPSSFFEEIKQQIPLIVRGTLRAVGYNADFPGINPDTCEIRLINKKPAYDIYQGVACDNGETGAGDQGLMFGYATDETPEFMPLPISLAHKLVKQQAKTRKEGKLPWLRPDAKAQVSVRYEDAKPVSVETVVLSTQHDSGVDDKTIKQSIIRDIIEPVIPLDLRSSDIKYLVNPTGQFIIGGPKGDTGLTGRKIIVDTYGGSCPHGGGAFSGKDPTKVDRSAAYMARYIAKNIVAAKLAKRCTIQMSYAIGIVEPISVYVDLHGTGAVDEEALERCIHGVFDLTPKGIIKTLRLQRPIYQTTAVYGHFGRYGDEFTWENIDHRSQLRVYFGLEVEAVVRNQKDVHNLSRYVKEMNSGHISKDMQAWWWSRY